jgi:excisionase family DNA binding protein
MRAMSDVEKARMVTLPEAQRLLGVSKRTAQRMIADGRLRGVKQGSRWLVEMPTDVMQAPVAGSDTVAKLRQEVAVLTSQRDKLTTDVARLQTDNDKLWQMVGELTRQNGQLLARIPALPAPYEPAPARSWWQRFTRR